MISTKRINSIKRELIKKNGDGKNTKFIINAKDGLYLVDLRNRSNRYRKIESLIDGYRVEELQEVVIDNILVCGDGRTGSVIIIDNVPDDIGEHNSII